MSAGLHVESVGTGSGLVLLHGWAMHGGWWTPLLPALARRFRVHVVDLPGHGHSATAGPMGVPEIAAALSARFAGESRLAVLGWSLGAQVAMAWAHAHPAQVGALVLTGATPRFVRGPDWAHGVEPGVLQRFGDELAAAYRLTLQRFLSLQVQGSAVDRAALAAMRTALFARGTPAPAALAAGLEALRTTDLRPIVPALAQPAVVVAGERDALTPAAAGRWLATHLPDARFVLVPGAGHVPFLSHPEAFLDAVEGVTDVC